jgi:hypothetical protein
VVHQTVPHSDILKRIHPRLRPAIELSVISGDSVDIFVYPPESRYVVSSKDVTAPLTKLARDPVRLVCVGYGFTQEARDLIHAHGGVAFSLEASFGWTDESWLSIHQTKTT